MGAKLLSPGHVSSWITSYDEEDTSEELIQIYKDSNPDAVQIFGEEKKVTLEMFIQSLQDDEADILRIIEEEKKHLLFDKNTITNIPSKITEAIENIDIESYKIWDDDNEPPAAPDAQPLDVIDMENDFEKRHKDGLIPTYCTYCTRYKRIKTANDVKRGDSIRLPRLKGIYYHHAIVKEVLKDNENPTCCSLTLIHLQKSDDSLKPAKTKVKEETIDYNFKQTVLEKVAYKNNPFTPDEIVHRAEEYMLKNKTEKIYNMFWNNCEHIESQLAQGVSESTQVIKKFDQFKSGLSWIFSVLCKIGSKILRLPGVSAIGIMQLLIDNIGKLKKLRILLAEKIICSGCFHREHKPLKIAISLSVIGLVLSTISHLNWVTLSISLIVGLAFPICAPLVIKYVMPLIQPAFLIPKHKMSAQNIPKAGDVVTFDYCSHEGVVTEVCSYTTDAKIAKATIIHFPWPGLFQKYTVTEEEVYLKLSEALFVVDHSFEETYQPAEVVRRAKNEVGNKNHSSLTYRSSHLARYCKTGEKTLKELPTRLVKTIEDVSPGDIIEFKYCGFSHEAVMVFFCFHCGAQYNLRSQLTRHVRDKHPKKMLQCRFCTYMVPTSKRFRLNEHEKNVHRHILNPRTNNRELIIPETPTRKPVTTSNFNTRQSCTVTRPREVTPPTTPILTRSIKPISPLSEISPCSISLGIEDYSSVSPVKKNLVDLFDSPTRQAVEEPREETSIVPEKPTPEPSIVTTLRDSRHLALPAIGDEVCPEDRFQAPPSRFQCSYEASKCMLVAEKAKKTGKYTGSVLPVGYGCVKKEEICILPDGTVYKLFATWVPDPSFQILRSKDIQTDERQVQQTSTQTEDKRVVLTTTATQTRRVIKKEREVQTEDCRVVMEKGTEEELELDIEEEYMDFDFYH